MPFIQEEFDEHLDQIEAVQAGKVTREEMTAFYQSQSQKDNAEVLARLDKLESNLMALADKDDGPDKQVIADALGDISDIRDGLGGGAANPEPAPEPAPEGSPAS